MRRGENVTIHPSVKYSTPTKEGPSHKTLSTSIRSTLLNHIKHGGDNKIMCFLNIY